MLQTSLQLQLGAILPIHPPSWVGNVPRAGARYLRRWRAGAWLTSWRARCGLCHARATIIFLRNDTNPSLPRCPDCLSSPRSFTPRGRPGAFAGALGCMPCGPLIKMSRLLWWMGDNQRCSPTTPRPGSSPLKRTNITEMSQFLRAPIPCTICNWNFSFRHCRGGITGEDNGVSYDPKKQCQFYAHEK